jgi:hypothetical protein
MSDHLLKQSFLVRLIHRGIRSITTEASLVLFKKQVFINCRRWGKVVNRFLRERRRTHFLVYKMSEFTYNDMVVYFRRNFGPNRLPSGVVKRQAAFCFKPCVRTVSNANASWNGSPGLTSSASGSDEKVRHFPRTSWSWLLRGIGCSPLLITYHAFM